MIDSTGDGQADLLVVDTTGDGQPDRPCESYGVDTTGDGRTDALLADTNGEGRPTRSSWTRPVTAFPTPLCQG